MGFDFNKHCRYDGNIMNDENNPEENKSPDNNSPM